MKEKRPKIEKKTKGFLWKKEYFEIKFNVTFNFKYLGEGRKWFGEEIVEHYGEKGSNTEWRYSDPSIGKILQNIWKRKYYGEIYYRDKLLVWSESITVTADTELELEQSIPSHLSTLAEDAKTTIDSIFVAIEEYLEEAEERRS